MDGNGNNNVGIFNNEYQGSNQKNKNILTFDEDYQSRENKINDIDDAFSEINNNVYTTINDEEDQEEEEEEEGEDNETMETQSKYVDTSIANSYESKPNIGEMILVTIDECNVFKLPPRKTITPMKAKDWDSSWHIWTGTLMIIRHHDSYTGEIRLIDTKTRELFATTPLDCFKDLKNNNVSNRSSIELPINVLESVSDSSRFFILNIYDNATSSKAYIGIGFQDRSKSFALNVALQDFYKLSLNKTTVNMNSNVSNNNQHDSTYNTNIKINSNVGNYSLKEGETISVKLNKSLLTKSKSNLKSNSNNSSNLSNLSDNNESNSSLPLKNDISNVSNILLSSVSPSSTTASIISNMDSTNKWKVFDNVTTSDTSTNNNTDNNSGSSNSNKVPSSWVTF